LLRADPLGPPVWWIVPKQATFMTERALTCAAGLSGFLRARVVSFELLGEEVLAACGGAAVPEVTPIGRQMILGHLLRKHQSELKFFGQSARHGGLAAKLDATFAEFERCGKDSQCLEYLLAQLGPEAERSDENKALADKVHDLKLVYDAYSAYLGQERLDQHRRLAQVIECMRGSEMFRGAHVFIDGFAQFTEFERRVIAQLGRVCTSVEVMLLMDPASQVLGNPHVEPGELDWFHPVAQTYKRLWITLAQEGVGVEGPVVLREVRRFTNPVLGILEREITRTISKVRDDPEGLEMLEAADRRAEVDACARRIRDLLRDGYRLRDIAVLVRDLEPYEELIRASFAEHDIEYFVDRRRSMAHHPLLQFTRAALLVTGGGWPHEWIMTLLKSGLSGLSDGDADELENYVLEHRIRGSAWEAKEPWTYSRRMLWGEDEESEGAKPQADRVDAMRRAVVGGLRPFASTLRKEALTVRDVVTALVELYSAFGVQGRLTKWMKDAHDRRQFERRDEHEQVWAHLVDLMEQMVALLGDEAVSLVDFIEVLESGLEGFELALAPPAVDEVLVGQVDRTRCPDVRAVFVLALNEGVFPRLPREDSVLSDAERRELRERRVEVEPDTRRRLLDENLLGYIALTRASDQVIVSRSLTDAAGKGLGPSPLWRRVVDLFPKVVVRRDSGEAIGTPRQLVTALMRWVWEGKAEGRRQKAGESTFAALYQWLATHPPIDDSIDVMRFRAWRALQYRNEAKLGREVVAKLFASPLRASVTRVETFAACPFRHFARFGLGLLERADDEVSSLDLGNVFHHVLERIVKSMLKQRKGWADLSESQRREMIGAFAQQVGHELRGEILLSSARNRYTLARIQRTLEQVTAAAAAAARRGRFSPAFAELGFGREGDPLGALEVVTPAKRKLLLQGKIDRVDWVEEQAAVAVVDYKLTGNALSLDRVYHGLSLQLLTYLLVLRESGERLAGKKLTPAAAFYVKLLRQLEDVKHPDDVDSEDPDELKLKVKPRGVLEGTFLPALDNQCGTGASKVVSAFVKNDGTLGRKGATDVVEHDEFEALTGHVRVRIAELGDMILDGMIEIRPYQLRQQSPCPNCEYRALCRFDPAVNRYRVLAPMGREDVLARVVQEALP
jgi:ATP-dependent helicase/nuclease subunit B